MTVLGRLGVAAVEHDLPFSDGESLKMVRCTTFQASLPRCRNIRQVAKSKLGNHLEEVGVTGFEPATSASRTQRSSQAEPHPVVGGSRQRHCRKQPALQKR